MGIKRLTYDAKGKHFCDYETRDIINRLAECEIMLKKIEQIVEEWENDDIDYEGHYGEDYIQKISEVLEEDRKMTIEEAKQLLFDYQKLFNNLNGDYKLSQVQVSELSHSISTVLDNM